MLQPRKNIVIIVGSYLPKPSAVGICAMNIVRELQKIHDVTVIATKTSSEDPEFEECDGYKIYRVYTRYWTAVFNIKNRKAGLWTKLLINKIKLLRLVKILSSKTTVDESLVEAYLNGLNMINNLKKIDVVIPFCFPFESIISSVKFKKNFCNQVMVIPYVFDNFTESASVHRFFLNRLLKMRANKKLEYTLLKESKQIFAMHPMRCYYESEYSTDIKNKIFYLEHPLILKPQYISSANENNLKMIYAGGFFNKVRPPRKILEILDELSLLIDFNVDIFGFGNAFNCVKKHKPKKEYLHVYGHVTKQQIQEILGSYNILLNVGTIDKKGKQISSKVFEYISECKPIIHFAYVENCVDSKILSKYPLAFIVPLYRNFSEFKDDLCLFINNNKNTQIDFSSVNSIFLDAIPNYAVKNLVKFIEEDDNENFN